MLVLSRKVGERILIGENISVTVVRVTGGGVRLGVEAPANMTVVRQELQDRKMQDRKTGDPMESPHAPTAKTPCKIAGG